MEFSGNVWTHIKKTRRRKEAKERTFDDKKRVYKKVKLMSVEFPGVADLQ